MKFSARTRYAARILLELAGNQDERPMSAAVLSQRTGVSAQFVEQILKPLKQKGFTSSVRGASGGHRLARPTDAISLGEVVRLMEGGIQLSVCCGDNAKDCPRKDRCLIRGSWVTVSHALERELDEITLASLLESGDNCPSGLSIDDKRKSAIQKKKTEVKGETAAPSASSPRSAVRLVVGRRTKALRPTP